MKKARTFTVHQAVHLSEETPLRGEGRLYPEGSCPFANFSVYAGSNFEVSFFNVDAEDLRTLAADALAFAEAIETSK